MKKYKANNKDLAIICDNLGSLYDAGIPFLTIFELMQEIDLSKPYKESISSIRILLNQGISLEAAFKSHNQLFPEFFISMIEIGEKTGRLSDVLKGLKLYFNKITKISNVLRDTLTYPIILIIAAILMMVFLLFTVVPSFAEIYNSMGKDIPKISQYVINLTNYTKENMIMTAIFFISWIVLTPFVIFKFFLKDAIYKLTYKIPIVSEITEYVAIMLLSVIVKSGVSLSLGLDFCSQSNTFNNLQNEFICINNKIMRGSSLSEAMEKTGLFSKYTLVHIRLGEESGGLENRLSDLENETFNKIYMKIKKVLQRLGPMLILLIGAFILIFIVVFILPLFDVMMGGINV